MLNRLLKFFKSNSAGTPHANVVPRSQHRLDESRISSNALKVIRSLQQEGFSAYLVGGGIRDLLLDNSPKDFDVATNATPEQVKKLFRSALIIGRRFKIVHARFGREIIEVTTFRGDHRTDDLGGVARSDNGMLLRDNVYGDIVSDAMRRDFTVNALYYDPSTGDLMDYVDGLRDLEQRTLRIIGDPSERYREDPVRMLRAVRFAAKLGFQLDRRSEQPIVELAPLMAHVPPARLFEEVLKLFLNGSATATFELLRETRLLPYLFPGLHDCLITQDPFVESLTAQTLINTDKRIRQNKRVTPAFIYAAFLWPPLLKAMKQTGDALPPHLALQQVASGVVSQQLASTAIPKRFLIPMREIWALQWRLGQRDGKKAAALLEHPRFRAAYDFLILREQAGEQLDGLGNWWTRFQTVSEQDQARMTQELGAGQKRRRPRKRRRKRPEEHNVTNEPTDGSPTSE